MVPTPCSAPVRELGRQASRERSDILSPDRGGLRIARGSVVGSFALASTVSLHSLAGGGTSASRVVLLAALASLVGAAASGRQWSFPRLLVVLLILQPVLHVLLTMSAHVHSAAVSDNMHATPVLTSSMAMAHLGAVFTTALALGIADGLLWRYISDAWLRWFRADRSYPFASSVRSMPIARHLDLRMLILVNAQQRRGPPAMALLSGA